MFIYLSIHTKDYECIEVFKMGDRASIKFTTNGESDSVVLFNHWGGKDFQKLAIKWAEDMYDEISSEKHRINDPVTRFEPAVMMVHFIKDYGTRLTSMGTTYLGASESDGDDSDNGCVTIRFSKEGITHDLVEEVEE